MLFYRVDKYKILGSTINALLSILFEIGHVGQTEMGQRKDHQFHCWFSIILFINFNKQGYYCGENFLSHKETLRS